MPSASSPLRSSSPSWPGGQTIRRSCPGTCSAPSTTFPAACGRRSTSCTAAARSGPLRALGWGFVALMVPSALYLGVALPRSLGCAAVLGWGVAAAVHLMFGSPGGRPTMDQVGQALADLGHPVTDVRLAERQPHAHTL